MIPDGHAPGSEGSGSDQRGTRAAGDLTPARIAHAGSDTYPHPNAFRGLALEALSAWESGSDRLLAEAMRKIRKATR